MGTHGFAPTAIEEMPCGNKIQGRVGRSETAAVEHTNKAVTTHEEVGRNKIAVAHNVETGRRQFTQPSPYATEPRHVQETLAVLETDRHPVVVVRKAAAPPLPIKTTAMRVRCS